MADQIVVIQTQQAVNQGDHAQDIVRAIQARPDETVQELIDRLYEEEWISASKERELVAQDEWYLTIRVAAR